MGLLACLAQLRGINEEKSKMSSSVSQNTNIPCTQAKWARPPILQYLLYSHIRKKQFRELNIVPRPAMEDVIPPVQRRFKIYHDGTVCHPRTPVHHARRGLPSNHENILQSCNPQTPSHAEATCSICWRLHQHHLQSYTYSAGANFAKLWRS
ncbi:hypothetical protein CC80DRAFT_70122 [Byssothecium circinans]|uniref:Uncharacterized protein n=1 Tax=Byssothecium circinans TaxID=147558 RepID=A0A6A5TZK6_9PLEO|nr:hypothetical protein CC80DRAFT_70122 [Byssothecium circinans]